MKFFTGLAVSAVLICTAGAANAQMAGGMRSVSDFDAPYDGGPYSGGPYSGGPYAGGPPPGLVPMPEEPPPPPAPRYYDRGYGGPARGYEQGYYNPNDRSGYQNYRYEPQQRGYGPEYGYAPSLLPPQEVYAILRQNGFSPLGAPRQRGYTYVIAAIDRGGEDGRVVIDGRNGRILRFMPASRWGQALDRMSYQRAPSRDLSGPLQAPVVIRASPQVMRPVPSVVRRAAPAQAAAPRPAPVATKPAEPLQKSAAVNDTRAAQPASQTSSTVGEARPAAPQALAAPQVKPTQSMPKVQGFE